jgi:hypothetical protein
MSKMLHDISLCQCLEPHRVRLCLEGRSAMVDLGLTGEQSEWLARGDKRPIREHFRGSL